MKILFSISYYHPYVSGLTLAAARWAEALARSGETVSVLTMRHEKKLRARERISSVSVTRASWIAKVSKGFISFDWLVKSWRLAGEHDVTVINLPQFEGIIPALAAKAQGKRVIAIYHCEIVLPHGGINSIIQSLLEVSNFGSLWLADTVITYTKDYARHSRLLGLLTMYKKRSVTAIVPPIPHLRKKKTLTDLFRRRIGTPQIVIGVAARLAEEKGMEYLFRAIPLLRDLLHTDSFKVVIAGPTDPVGEASYKQRIMKLVRTYKKQVVFLGEIAPHEMGSFYAMIHMLVLPSVNSTEAFGLVQAEAMLAGIPVVASDLPGVRVPVAKTGMGIVVPPEDSTALARAIAAICKTPDMYTKQTRIMRNYFSAPRSLNAFRRIVLGKSYENNN